ncbi:secretion system X translation initiation factor [Pseudomonas sp. A46]|nr:secretion system X translation initiation factor [Pseudomonas sp. A46]OWJ97546.1 secretion system X translation initiation factor [Pseudomonas sp. A46]
MARRLFWLAFLGSAAALAVVPEFLGERAEPRAMPHSQAPAAAPRLDAPSPAAAGESLEAPPALVPAADLFASQSWFVAPPPPPPVADQAPPPAPKPTAPPLPFRFIGRMDDRLQQQVFLLRGEEVLVVREGDLIGDTYQVRRIEPERMTLVYLPLDKAQTLTVGRSK